MNSAELIASLATSGAVIRTFFSGITEEQARWKPAAEKWSLLEILCHLGDEEVDDFRRRLRSTLEDPTAPWPPIDPEGWARDRKYNEKSLADALARFESERASSLAWLSGLTSPDWSRAHPHPQIGELRAGDLLASWAAHDLLHLRQLASTRLAWLCVAAAPRSTAYAGA